MKGLTTQDMIMAEKITRLIITITTLTEEIIIKTAMWKEKHTGITSMHTVTITTITESMIIKGMTVITMTITIMDIMAQHTGAAGLAPITVCSEDETDKQG